MLIVADKDAGSHVAYMCAEKTGVQSSGILPTGRGAIVKHASGLANERKHVSVMVGGEEFKLAIVEIKSSNVGGRRAYCELSQKSNGRRVYVGSLSESRHAGHVVTMHKVVTQLKTMAFSNLVDIKEMFASLLAIEIGSLSKPSMKCMKRPAAAVRAPAMKAMKAKV